MRGALIIFTTRWKQRGGSDSAAKIQHACSFDQGSAGVSMELHM